MSAQKDVGRNLVLRKRLTQKLCDPVAILSSSHRLYFLLILELPHTGF